MEESSRHSQNENKSVNAIIPGLNLALQSMTTMSANWYVSGFVCLCACMYVSTCWCLLGCVFLSVLSV